MNGTPWESTPTDGLQALLARHVVDVATSWSVGTFGAIAEFRRDADEPATVTVEDDRFSVSTARGAISLGVVPGMRAIAYETPGGRAGSWGHAVALCLPSPLAFGHRRQCLTELGHDLDAIRTEDGVATLFDVGLGCAQADLCVRSEAVAVLTALRAGVGRSLLEPGNPLMADMPRLSPHRVFSTALARVEVYQPVPPPHGITPSGPHTHVLPTVVRETRTHAATVPIPEGWVPCAYLYPAHPAVDDEGRSRPFDATAHTAFQALLGQYGDVALRTTKTAVLDALDRGDTMPLNPSTLTRHARATVRVTLRQWAVTHSPSDALRCWVDVFDATGGDQLCA